MSTEVVTEFCVSGPDEEFGGRWISDSYETLSAAKAVRNLHLSRGETGLSVEMRRVTYSAWKLVEAK